jgi:GNAT superfamily N-acetyltransferase
LSHPLDNPIWHALTGPQREFGRVGARSARYHPQVSPLAAVAEESDAAFAELASLNTPGEVIALISERPLPERDWQALAQIQLGQWLHSGEIAPASEDGISVLGPADAATMFALARLTDPGPFETETWRLGTYLGIRVDSALVAMAGERIRLPGFAEVSAVATRPGHEGKGYASRLVHALVARHQAAGEQSFLHVRTGSPSEPAATRVYEKLGYRLRHRAAFRIGRRREVRFSAAYANPSASRL